MSKGQKKTRRDINTHLCEKIENGLKIALEILDALADWFDKRAEGAEQNIYRRPLGSGVVWSGAISLPRRGYFFDEE